MVNCKCDLGNILDEEIFNVRVNRELCNIYNSVGSTELLRMVDQTDDGDVQFIRTSNGDFELDGETSYTPIGTVIPYKISVDDPILDDGIFRFTINVPDTNTIEPFSINYAPSVSDYVVDWGDGSSSVGQTTHSYSSPGTYQIHIHSGESNQFPFVTFPNNPYIISVDSVYPYINFTGAFTSVFAYSSIRTICRGLFKNNSQITGATSIFRGCTNLLTIPDDLCSYFVNVTRMNHFFNGSGISTLPKGLLDNCVELTEIYNFCTGCTNLTSVPEYLFRYNTKCYTFEEIFKNCINLKLNKNIFCDEATEKTTRFANMPGVGYIYFNNSFTRDSYTGTEPGEAPSLWEYSYQPTLSSNQCYSGAGNNSTSLSNYNSIPSTWGGPA